MTLIYGYDPQTIAQSAYSELRDQISNSPGFMFQSPMPPIKVGSNRNKNKHHSLGVKKNLKLIREERAREDNSLKF